ncbi:DinB family protein [Sapientia aquatica]|nr:DinB family protein [Sapientia aquatica]
MPSNFALFARYNAEMNERQFLAGQQLTPEALMQERGAFFGSILGTMNHLIVADTLWLQRIAEHPRRFASLHDIRTWAKPSSLTDFQYKTLADWITQRRILDRLIAQLVAEITDADLSSVLHYQRTDGTPGSKYLNDVLTHFFNHQTHHRGQISTLFFQAGVDVGVTDLMSLVPDVM